jgi:hypothetical protein
MATQVHFRERLSTVEPRIGSGSRRQYSPDLNPIEQTFAKIKHWMRQDQKRTVEDTWRHIGTLVATIQPDECDNYFANAGYASVKP